MKYSVVVPVFLREDSHRQVVIDMLESVKEASKDFELIIINNGSLVMSGFLKDYADVYIKNSDNLGIAPAWNQGMEAAHGDYIAICNDDILVPEHWLEALEEPFHNHLDCGVTAPMIAGPQERPFILNGKKEKEDYKFYPGYCFMLNKERFFEKFDEQFVLFNYEDTDYWTRIKKAKLRLMRAPLSIWHKEGDVVHKFCYERVNTENYQRFKDKWKFDPQPYFYGDKNIEDII